MRIKNHTQNHFWVQECKEMANFLKRMPFLAGACYEIFLYGKLSANLSAFNIEQVKQRLQHLYSRCFNKSDDK